MESQAGQQRLLYLIKLHGPQSTKALATALAITLPGARKHLKSLLRKELVAFEDIARSVGRPSRLWRLTPAAEGLFPDAHAALTLDLISSARQIIGDDGLDRLISEREGTMAKRYRTALSGCEKLPEKVARLAQIRSEEGYMAEARELGKEAFLLIENHCPICAAARVCQGVCRSELRLFAAALGPGARIERAEHILSGARRCTYRITPQDPPAS
ncbi:MAG: transcriptional regulator [Rhizobiales bacterium]|nr:transcriptional regulator [Hyphomicrobiales bacterium]